MSFTVLKKSKKTKARLTSLVTAHGAISGPFFMPIATRGAVKNIMPSELLILGAQIILSNTYHLMLTPGVDVVKKSGGIHSFMGWNGPILTDSGGFQVFSLSRLRKVTESGVVFSDPRSGNKMDLGPKKSIQAQVKLGVDIAMAFDHVIGYPASKNDTKVAMERTHRWEQLCRDEHIKIKTKKKPLLFGIVQGGTYKDLREQSAKTVTEINFDGYAVGGVAVGEPRDMMPKILNWVMKYLPEEKPRYLMGLGRPEEIVQAVKMGVDMFDCVIPTREARHGRLYIWRGVGDVTKNNFYTTVNVTNRRFANNFDSINKKVLGNYTFAYLHHLFKTQEPLAGRIATLQNLSFYLDLMAKIRKNIKRGKL